MESINNIFFKIKFYIQKNLKSIKKREKYIKLRLQDCVVLLFYYYLFFIEFFNNKYILKNCVN